MMTIYLIILIIILLIIIIFLTYDIDDIEEQKNYVKSLPVRPRLSVNDPIEEYRKKHPIIVSLTTSPTRISKIKNVLDTLDLDSIDYIIIAIPMKFGRDQSEYIIPEELKNFPKVKILRIEKDLGPITKLIPTIEYAKYELKDDDAIVITIDDDTAYPKGMIRELTLNVISNENTAASGSGQNIDYWGIYSIFPYTNKDMHNTNHTQSQDLNKYVDVIEGFSGIALKPKYVDIELMKYLSESKSCFVSDDMVISFVLALSGINRLKVSNPYFSVEKIKQYKYGLKDDALHRGAGLDDKQSTYLFNDANHEKYKTCYDNLLNATLDYNLLQFKKKQNILQN